MAKKLVVAVCSYVDNLVPSIICQAGNKFPDVEFLKIRFPLYDYDPVKGKFSAEEENVFQTADIALADPPVVASYMSLFKEVKWVHSPYAGVDAIASLCPPVPNYILTRQVGDSYGQQMAEYVLVQILARERKLFSIESDMRQKDWHWGQGTPRTLPSLSIGVLGVGSIGGKVAELCKATGMTVWGLTRTNTRSSDAIDHRCQMSQLPELLDACDYVCNVLPSTVQTKGLLDGDILQHCSRQKSVFINIGRGDIVSEQTILRAIENGWLGGAILDVFHSEPLPQDSPLWNTHGVTLTPHMSGLGDTSEIATLFLSNLKRYLSGQQLEYVVDFTCGY